MVQLKGMPSDAHNEDPALFSPNEWADVVAWIKSKLELDSE